MHFVQANFKGSVSNLVLNAIEKGEGESPEKFFEIASEFAELVTSSVANPILR